MEYQLRIGLDGVDWAAVSALFERVEWGKRDPLKLQRAFERSHQVCFVYAADCLVGLGRIISDGEFYALLVDVIVDPAHQKRGVGRMIVESLVESVSHLNWIHLTSTPGNEPFYSRFGFRLQKTAMAIMPHAKAPNLYVH